MARSVLSCPEKRLRRKGKGEIKWHKYLRRNGSERQDDPKVAHTKPEALDDISHSRFELQQLCRKLTVRLLLAEFGAEVIKIEPPEGDFLRTCTPYGVLHKGEGLNYLSEGRNKFHITLNLEKAEGQEDAGRVWWPRPMCFWRHSTRGNG